MYQVGTNKGIIVGYIQNADFFSVKHIQFIVIWMCFTAKNLHFVYIQENIGMTNVKKRVGAVLM